jgi:hypothetical protein
MSGEVVRCSECEERIDPGEDARCEKCVDREPSDHGPVVPACRSCRHWDPYWGVEKHGICGKIGNRKQEGPAYVEADCGYDCELRTAAQFGCTLFEGK